MRKLYVPNKKLYRDYYCGHGHIPVFEGKIRQEGYGIGNILGGLFRSAMPLLKNIGKKVGSQLLQGGKDVLEDVLAGENIKSSLKKRAMERAKKLLKNDPTIEGHSYYNNKRKRTRSTPNKSRKRRCHRKKKDIFDY
jgi:hypothetical protein